MSSIGSQCGPDEPSYGSQRYRGGQACQDEAVALTQVIERGVEDLGIVAWRSDSFLEAPPTTTCLEGFALCRERRRLLSDG